MARRPFKSIQRSALVVLFALVCQQCWARADLSDEEEQDRLVKKFTSNWIYVFELLIVIILSLLFEKGHDYLSEKFRSMGRQGEALNLMMDCLTNEIMILGFIGLLVYVFTKTDVALDLARKIYPSNLKLSEEHDPLADTFELVHMIIFCVMVCFISQVSLLMYKSVYLESVKWRHWEHIRVGKLEQSMQPEHSEKVHSAHSEKVHSLRRLSPFVRFVAEKWRQKKARREFETIADLMLDCGYSQDKNLELEMNPLMRIFSRNDVRDLLQWRLLRHDFMFPYHDESLQESLQPANMYKPREPAFFEFSMYLDTKMGETFVKLIEVDYATWGLMAFFSLFLPWVVSFGPDWYSTVAAICSWSIVLVMFIFGLHIVDVYNKLTPMLPPAIDGGETTPAVWLKAMKGTSANALKGKHRRQKGDLSKDASSLKLIDESSSKSIIASTSDSLHTVDEGPATPLLPKKEDELSHRFLPRNIKSKTYFKFLEQGGRPWYLNQMAKLKIVTLNQAPNEQERFFFFHEASPRVYKHFVGDLLFFQSVVTSMYLVLVFLCDVRWDWAQLAITVFGLCGPILNLFWLVPKIVGKVVMITSIDYMKDKHVVEDVIIEVKRHQLLESMKILEFARMEGKLHHILADQVSPEGLSPAAREADEARRRDETRAKYSNIFESFSEKKKGDIKHLFELFDEDNSGSISKEEMNAVIMSMNISDAAVQAANKLWDLVDEDHSGSVEWEEFTVLMAMVLSKEQPIEEKEEDDKALFRKFDKDGSGEITITELAEGFVELGVELDVDSIASLVSQVFKKSKQKLKEDDFIALMSGLEAMSEKGN